MKDAKIRTVKIESFTLTLFRGGYCCSVVAICGKEDRFFQVKDLTPYACIIELELQISYQFDTLFSFEDQQENIFSLN